MFNGKKKQKKFSREYELKGVEHGGFILRITDLRVDVETKNKEWKVVFSRETYEYGFIYNMLVHQDLAGLYNIAVAIFLTRILFRDVRMVEEVFQLADKVNARIKAETPAPKQSDEMILAEEKVLSEKTPEAIRELEELKQKEESQKKPTKKKK